MHIVKPAVLKGTATALRLAGDNGEHKKLFVQMMRGPVEDAKKDVQAAVRSLPVSAHKTWTGAGSGALARAAYGAYRSSASIDREQARLARAYDYGAFQKRAARAAGRAGLRESIARATGTSVRVSGKTPGLKVKIDPTRHLPPDQRTLPYHLDQPGGWRHPLFGNRSKWVQQQGKPYFVTTIMKNQKDYIDAAQDAMDEFADFIMRRARG